jgi:DNA-binding MarR family transcriptional regulator
MHAAFFGIKRAYWGSLRTTRRKLTKMGLTAARFDLLYLLWEVPWPGARTQKEITRELGVSRSVVSRMLKSLREIGLVERMRDPCDRRGWLIALTEEGLRRIRRAIRFFVRRGGAWRRVQRGLCPGMPKGERRENLAFWRMCKLEVVLDRLRRGFRARGRLHYPWHPDD